MLGFGKESKKKDSIELKYAKLKLHVTYLLIIAVIMAVIGIAIGLGDDLNFAAEISMASTVSSIILSAVAIFMSISGENKNSYTQNKIMETADGLSDVVEQMQKIGNNVSDVLDEKLDELSLIKDELKNLKGNVNEMRQLFDVTVSSKDKVVDSGDINNDEAVKKYMNILENIKNRNELGARLLAEMLQYVVTIFAEVDQDISLSRKEVGAYMSEKRNQKNEKIIEAIWHMAIVFNCMGVGSDNKQLLAALKEKLEENIGDSHKEEIIRFHNEYQNDK